MIEESDADKHYKIVDQARETRLRSRTGFQVYKKMRKFLEAKIEIIERDITRHAMGGDIVRLHLSQFEKEILDSLIVWMDCKLAQHGDF